MNKSENYTMHTTDMMETRSGIAWVADLLRDGIKIGGVENQGDGGADYVFFTVKTERADWRLFVAEKHEDDEEKATEWLLFQEEATSMFADKK